MKLYINASTKYPEEYSNYKKFVYHYEDVSAQERELFYKNKKSESGGFKPAMKVR